MLARQVEGVLRDASFATQPCLCDSMDFFWSSSDLWRSAREALSSSQCDLVWAWAFRSASRWATVSLSLVSNAFISVLGGIAGFKLGVHTFTMLVRRTFFPSVCKACIWAWYFACSGARASFTKDSQLAVCTSRVQETSYNAKGPWAWALGDIWRLEIWASLS